MHDIARTKGMVLLSTMCIIFMITLLVLSSVQQNLLYAKALGRLQIADRDFYEMENIAQDLLTEKTERCTIKNSVVTDVRNFIKNKGCSISVAGHPYKYIIEMLGIFPCWIIKTENKAIASQHRRLYLMKMYGAEPWQYLQLHVIDQGVENPSCMDKESVVEQGIQSWHFVSW